MARLNSLGFPRGFPIKSNSAAGEALQRNGIFLPFFFVLRSKYSFYDSAYRLDTLAPPSLRIDIQGDTARTAGVPHVVTGNLKAGAEAPHQAGVHGPEAAKVDGLRKSQLFRRRLQVPVEQIVPVKRLANLVGENKIVRFAEFRIGGPHLLYRREQNSMFVERHFPLAGIRLYLIELIIVNSLVNDDPIAKDVLPSKRKSLARAHG